MRAGAILFVTAAILSGCGQKNASLNKVTSTSSPDSVTVNTDSTLTVVSDGKQIKLPETTRTHQGAKIWQTADARGALRETDELVTFAGYFRSTPFAAISGLRTPPSGTGQVVAKGRYSLYDAEGTAVEGPIALNVDFDANTVKGGTGDLSVDAQIKGASLSGTASHEGAKAPLNGGFYGKNTLAGATNGGKDFVANFVTEY